MKRFFYIYLLCVSSIGGYCTESVDLLKIAHEALSDNLHRVAQVNAEKALKDSNATNRQVALEILLESLARQNKYAEVLNVLEQNSSIVVSARNEDSLRYWRVLALFNEERFNDIANIINSGSVGTNSFYDVATMRIAARTRALSGDVAGATELFAKVDLSTTNLTIRTSNALEWAVSLDKRAQYDEALDVLKQLSQFGVNNTFVNEGALLRGRILMRLGRVVEGTRIMDALAMNEHVAEIPRVQALVEMSVYKLDSALTNEAVAYARSAYERAQLAETRKLAGFRLGDLLCNSADTIEEGAKIIKALVREFPEHSDSMHAHLKLADSYLQLNQAEQAAAEYRVFLETYPSSALDVRVLQGRGWALFKLKRFTEAGLTFEKAAELTDVPAEKVECVFKRCDALMAAGRYVDAANAYADLNKRFPDLELAGKALYLSAEALERAGDMDAALALYLKTAQRYPHKDVASDSLLRAASIQSAKRELDQALDIYSLVLKNFTNNSVVAKSYLGRGKVYYSKFQFDKAMQDFAAVAEVAPDRIDEARYFLILTLYGLGRDSEALESAGAFVIGFPNSNFLPDMLLWLGKFHFNRSNFVEAVKYFKAYATGFEDRKWADAALLWQARALFSGGDYTLAIETIAKMVSRFPESSRILEARFVQAESLIELARFDAAILLLDNILEQDPESVWGRKALLRKGNCLFALGAGNRVRYEDALAVYQRATQMPGLTSAALIELFYKTGRCLEKLERFDEAVDCYYSQVLLRYLKDKATGTWYNEETLSLVVRAAFSVAEIFEKKGEYEQAVSVLEKIRKSVSAASDEALRRINVLKNIRGS